MWQHDMVVVFVACQGLTQRPLQRDGGDGRHSCSSDADELHSARRIYVQQRRGSDKHVRLFLILFQHEQRGGVQTREGADRPGPHRLPGGAGRRVQCSSERGVWQRDREGSGTAALPLVGAYGGGMYVLICCLLCIYMPAIDRPLSDCRYKSGNDQTGEVTVAPGKSTKFNTNHSDKWQATVSGEAKTLHEWTIDGRDGAFCTMEVRHPAYEEIQPRPGNHIGNPTTIDCHGYFVTGCLCCRSWDG